MSASAGMASRGGRGAATGLAVAMALLAAPAQAEAQISPGPLSRAHESLEGPLRCTACHGRGKGSLPDRCLDCHREIAWARERGRGLHALAAADGCAGCHPEHAGRDFALIEWTEGSAEDFDHDRTGWVLEGHHAALDCSRCHRPELQISPVLEKLERRRPEKSWLGLETSCVSCHEDPHRGALDADCRTCHTQRKWKPAPGFDHARTVYPLTGKHADVSCDKCHLDPRLAQSRDGSGRAVPVYKPVPHDDCGRCHQDVHRARLGDDCARCHVTDSFAAVDRRAMDHDRTRYPLVGRHRNLDCAVCHDPVKAWGKKPAFDTCAACHRDPHGGLATLQGRKADCAGCHGMEGFRPSTYTASRHRTAAYPLEGRHEAVPCAGCHPGSPQGAHGAGRGEAGVLLRPAYERCRDCHEDAHGGQLAARPGEGACEPCHRVEGWKPSLFDGEQHARLRLALEGRHAAVECAACHGPARTAGLPPLPGPAVLGRARVAVTLEDARCVACHHDPHEGRFSSGGERERDEGCPACHGLDRFRPSLIDIAAHRRTPFPLEGAHRATPCTACHEELAGLAGPARHLTATGSPARMPLAAKHELCADCHDTPHGTQLDARPDGGRCESCHDVERFNPATRFDHGRDAAFRLDGAHAAVPCADCHPAEVGRDGRPMVVYRPRPTTCKGCHGGTPLRSPDRRAAADDRSLIAARDADHRTSTGGSR